MYKYPVIIVYHNCSYVCVYRLREYPLDCPHPVKLAHTFQCTDRPSAINSCCFSGCGQHLTCATSDHTVYTVRMPLLLNKTKAFVGEMLVYVLLCRIF